MSLAAPTEELYDEINVAGTSFVTDSWTPTAADRLLLAPVWLSAGNSTSGVAVGIPTLTGNGLDWEMILYTPTMDTGTKRLALFAAYGEGTAGALTVGGLGTTSHQSAIVGVYEQVGPTSLDAIVQSNYVTTNNLGAADVTLGEFSGAENSTFAVFGHKGNASAVNPGAGMTALRNDSIDTQRRALVEYRLSPDTSPGITLTDSGVGFAGNAIYGIAIEIAEATGTGWEFETELTAIDELTGGTVLSRYLYMATTAGTLEPLRGGVGIL